MNDLFELTGDIEREPALEGRPEQIDLFAPGVLHRDVQRRAVDRHAEPTIMDYLNNKGAENDN